MCTPPSALCPTLLTRTHMGARRRARRTKEEQKKKEETREHTQGAVQVAAGALYLALLSATRTGRPKYFTKQNIVDRGAVAKERDTAAHNSTTEKAALALSACPLRVRARERERGAGRAGQETKTEAINKSQTRLQETNQPVDAEPSSTSATASRDSTAKRTPGPHLYCALPSTSPPPWTPP